MDASGFAALATFLLITTAPPFLYVFIHQSPKWRSERASIKVRVRPEGDSPHSFVGDFAEWNRNHGPQETLSGKNGDAFSLFYTKKLLYGMTFLFSMLSGALVYASFIYRTANMVSEKIPFSEIAFVPSSTPGQPMQIEMSFIVFCGGLSLFALSVIAGFVSVRQIDDSLTELKLERAPTQ